MQGGLWEDTWQGQRAGSMLGGGLQPHGFSKSQALVLGTGLGLRLGTGLWTGLGSGLGSYS